MGFLSWLFRRKQTNDQPPIPGSRITPSVKVDDEQDMIKDLVLSESLRTGQMVFAHSNPNGTVTFKYGDGTELYGRLNDKGDLETDESRQ